MSDESKAIVEAAPLDLLADVEDTFRIVRGILSEAKTSDNPKLALLAAHRIAGLAELLAKLRGELQDGTTVAIHMAPEFRAMQDMLMTILAPYPEVRADVARALLASSRVEERRP